MGLIVENLSPISPINFLLKLHEIYGLFYGYLWNLVYDDTIMHCTHDFYLGSSSNDLICLNIIAVWHCNGFYDIKALYSVMLWKVMKELGNFSGFHDIQNKDFTRILVGWFEQLYNELVLLLSFFILLKCIILSTCAYTHHVWLNLHYKDYCKISRQACY